MGSQSGRKKKRDESSESFCRTSFPDQTDCTWVSQDALEFEVSAIEIQVRFAENVPTDVIFLVVLAL